MADGHSSLEHACLHLGKAFWRFDYEVGVGYVSAVIDREAQADDQLDDDDVVKGEVPEVNQSHQVDVDESHSKYDKHGHWEGARDEEHDKEDSTDRQTNTEESLF